MSARPWSRRFVRAAILAQSWDLMQAFSKWPHRRQCLRRLIRSTSSITAMSVMLMPPYFPALMRLSILQPSRTIPWDGSSLPPHMKLTIGQLYPLRIWPRPRACRLSFLQVPVRSTVLVGRWQRPKAIRLNPLRIMHDRNLMPRLRSMVWRMTTSSSLAYVLPPPADPAHDFGWTLC